MSVPPPDKAKGLLISDFTVEGLAALFQGLSGFPRIEAVAGPFGKVESALLDPAGPLSSVRPDFVLVWTRPEAAIDAFRRLVDHEPVALKDILAEVDEFCAMVLSVSERSRLMLVPAWHFPGDHRGLGIMEMRPGIGVASVLSEMNLRLARRLHASNVFVLNSAPWFQAAGPSAFDSKTWYMGKIPFGLQVFKRAAADIQSALRSASGLSKKLVLVDLDDTLWGGIVGENGWESLRLGGHDPIGEAFADFQNALRSVARRGILLGIVSRNEESAALKAIDNHPEMRLRRKDFAGWRINWRDKAANIAELVSELNLGLDSVVFVDDSAAERARVREALPEVLVPEWPKDPMLYARTLRSMDCFDSVIVSAEDRGRGAMMAQDRRRDSAKLAAGSLERWLGSLDLRVTVEPVGAGNLGRTVQLLNKTNQMNLATRRMTEKEFAAWASVAGRQAWCFRVSDRFGDSGLTGVLSLANDGDHARLVDFVLSCRVFGRKVEHSMVHWAVARARINGKEKLVAQLLPTDKNSPCLQFWKSSGFSSEGETFIWDLRNSYPLPGHVNLTEAKA